MSNTTTGQSKDDRNYAWHRHPALLAGIPAVAAGAASVLTIVLGQAGALPQSINPPESFAAGKGTAFCVRSGGSVNPHVGLFRVQSWNATTGRVELEVTVWTTS